MLYVYMLYVYMLYVYMLYVYIYMLYYIYNQTMFALLFCQTRCVFLGGSHFLIRFLIAGRSCMRGRMPRATWSSEGCRHGLRRSGYFFTGDLGLLSWWKMVEHHRKTIGKWWFNGGLMGLTNKMVILMGCTLW